MTLSLYFQRKIMEKYIKVIENNKIIFKNLLDGSELKIAHYEDELIFDTIFINEKYDLDFINYVIHQLKKSQDLRILFVEYNSSIIEKTMYKNGLKVLNYQYTIKKSKNFELNSYQISNILNQEEKNFYLNIINKLSQENSVYLNLNKQYQKYSEKWFDIEGFEYRVYRKMGKIAGIVDYKNFDYDSNYEEHSSEYFNYNNKLCIRCLLSEEEQVIEDILKDLLTLYQKDIIINITYNEKSLHNVVNRLNSQFDFCQYILVDNDKK